MKNKPNIVIFFVILLYAAIVLATTAGVATITKSEPLSLAIAVLGAIGIIPIVELMVKESEEIARKNSL